MRTVLSASDKVNVSVTYTPGAKPDTARVTVVVGPHRHDGKVDWLIGQERIIALHVLHAFGDRVRDPRHVRPDVADFIELADASFFEDGDED